MPSLKLEKEDDKNKVAKYCYVKYEIAKNVFVNIMTEEGFSQEKYPLYFITQA